MKIFDCFQGVCNVSVCGGDVIEMFGFGFLWRDE